MQQQLDLLEKRTEKLEVQSKKNSQNSSKPPSSYSPYTKPKKKTKNSKQNVAMEPRVTKATVG